MAIRSTSGQSTSPRRARLLRPPADDSRRRPESRADEETDLPDAVVAPRRPRRTSGPLGSSDGHAEIDLLDVEERRSEEAARESVERGRDRRSSAGCGRRPRAVLGWPVVAADPGSAAVPPWFRALRDR